jgi:hypothetical protein
VTVNLSPVDDLSLSAEITDVVDRPYCGNCTHLSADDSSGAYCTLHDDQTQIIPGQVCQGYVPAGMEHLVESDG